VDKQNYRPEYDAGKIILLITRYVCTSANTNSFMGLHSSSNIIIDLEIVLFTFIPWYRLVNFVYGY